MHECSGHGRSSRVGLLVLATALAAAPSAFAQEPRSNLGLPATAGIGLHAGFARLERDSDGFEAGGVLDLGWMRGRSLRLQAEASLLRATLTEFIEVEDSTYRGRFFDFAAGATAVWLPRPDARFAPFLLGGVAVHALSSTFGTLVLDRRYNTNRFGSHIGAGVRWRPSDGIAVTAEARRIIADETDRTLMRVGSMLLMGDLGRRARRASRP